MQNTDEEYGLYARNDKPADVLETDVKSMQALASLDLFATAASTVKGSSAAKS